MDVDNERHLRRFLLRQQTDAERAANEDRLVTDPSYFERLAALDDELILEFHRGELAPDEREAFAAAYLSSPFGRARVDATADLIAAVTSLQSETGTKSRPWTWANWLAARQPVTQFALAGSVACALILSTLAVQRTLTPTADAGGSTGSRLAVVASLAPVATRGDNGTTANLVSIPRSAREVWLETEVPESAAGGSLVARLRAVGSSSPAVVVGPPRTVAQGPVIQVTVPIDAALLQDGDYVLTLERGVSSGIDVAATRTFRAARATGSQ